MNDIRDVDLTRALPEPLKSDPDMRALGMVIAGELQENIRLAQNAVIFARIDELPEELLDILARDFNVGWYKDSYSIEIKRLLIRECVRIHKRKGTKWAVETALQALYPNTTVEEWFEYGGEPHFFRVHLNITGAAPEDIPDIDTIRRTIWLYKRLSSWLEDIIFTLEEEIEVTDYHSTALHHHLHHHITSEQNPLPTEITDYSTAVTVHHIKGTIESPSSSEPNPFLATLENSEFLAANPDTGYFIRRKLNDE